MAKVIAKLRKIYPSRYICFKSMKQAPVIFIISLLFVLTSCLDDADCVTTTTDFVNLRFYDRENNLIDTLNLVSLTAVGSDSVLVADSMVTAVRVPLDPQNESATYVFNSQFGRHTLTLSYALGTRLISEDCGVEIIYSQLALVSHSFDSVSVVNTVPVEDITEDIKVYN
jgi:hypothetical protein